MKNKTIDGTKEILLRGETLRLLPEGALYWPRERALVVADFHLGKSETFGKEGFVLPAQAQSYDLSRLAHIGLREGAQSLLFLGDLVHTLEALTLDLRKKLIHALKPFRGDVTLIVGNHDRSLINDWPSEWSEIKIRKEWAKGPFLFRHEPPPAAYKGSPFVWAGHVHPCVNLKGSGDHLRLKTFVVYQCFGLLPAFSSLAGGYAIKPSAKIKLYPLAENRVYEMI